MPARTLAGVHMIQLARSQWLMIDDHYKPRFLIVEEPVVLKETWETHVKHVIRWWHISPKERTVQAVCDGLIAAEAWCRDADAQERAKKAELSASLDIRKSTMANDAHR